jgi:hypothetical protein
LLKPGGLFECETIIRAAQLPRKVNVMFGYWDQLPWRPYSRFRAGLAGKKDGQAGFPVLDQTHFTPYEDQLKQICEENVKRLAQQWQRADLKLHADYCNAKGESEALSKQIPAAQTEAENAQAAFDSARDLDLSHLHFSPLAYAVLLLGIAVGEVPLNSIVFQLFGDSTLLNYAMSLTLALVLPVCAHFLGGLLRQGFLKGDKFTTHSVWIVLLSIIPVGTLGGIAYIREKFFEAADTQRVLGVKLDFQTVTLIFFFINLLIFLVASVASYVAHDPDAIKARAAFKAARRRLKTATDALARMQAKAHAAEARMQELYAKRTRLHARMTHEGEECKDIVQRLISVYRQYNMRARADKTLPECFKRHPEMDMLASLTALDWECGRGTIPASVEAQASAEAPGILADPVSAVATGVLTAQASAEAPGILAEPVSINSAAATESTKAPAAAESVSAPPGVETASPATGESATPLAGAERVGPSAASETVSPAAATEKEGV